MKKFGLKELIIGVLLTAVIYVLDYGTSTLTYVFAMNLKLHLIVMASLQCLITAPVYYLLIKKTGRTGGVAIMGIASGVIVFISGTQLAITLIIGLVFAILTELVMLKGGYQSKWRGFLVVALYHVMMLLGMILPYKLFPDAMKNALISSGMTEEVANMTFSSLIAVFNNLNIIALDLVAIFGFSAIGFYLGHLLIHRHFSPSGKV